MAGDIFKFHFNEYSNKELSPNEIFRIFHILQTMGRQWKTLKTKINFLLSVNFQSEIPTKSL